MKALNFLLNLAASLFLAPTPGLLLLMYAHGGSAIPPLQGGVVMAVSAAAYWVWLINRRNGRAMASHAERARSLAVGRPDVIDPLDPGEPVSGAFAEPSRASRVRTAEERRRADAALRGHEDLPDPMAEGARRRPSEILLDRVADLRQLKALVAENEIGLLNAFYRTVQRDEYGAPDYSDWAYEADRFLLSSAFMARTLNRHEAIATVTAEVEFLAGRTRGGRSDEERGRRRQLPAPTPDGLQPARSGAETGLPESVRRRLAARGGGGAVDACSAILAQHGWTAQATDAPGTDAIDLFAERGEIVVGLLCRCGQEIDEPAVRAVAAARDRFGLDGAGIVGTDFAKGARALATVTGVFLLDEEDLHDLHLYVGHRRKVVPLFRTAQGQS